MNILKSISNNDLEKVYNYFIKNNYEDSELYNIIQNIYVDRNYDFPNENQDLIKLLENTYKILLKNNITNTVSKSKQEEEEKYETEWIVVNLDF